MNQFKSVLSVLDQIAETSSTLKKQEIIAANAGSNIFRRVVDYALNPYRTFKCSGVLVAEKAEIDLDPQELFDMLDQFSQQSATTNAEREALRKLACRGGMECVQITNKILNKDLRINAGIKLFKKASRAFNFLPEHQPMKGYDDYEGFMQRAADRKNVCYSLKLDGTRTWAIIEPSTIIYLSSNGHSLDNFHCFDERLREVYTHVGAEFRENPKLILDGEVVNIQGDFSKHMSQFRRLKDMDNSGFRFRVFDVVESGNFSDRYEFISTMGLPYWKPGDTEAENRQLVSIVPHLQLDKHPQSLLKKAIADGYEGLMLKTWNHLYEYKRSWAWCKMKITHTEDLPVVGKVGGTGKYAGTLGALIVKRGEVEIEVGSGYTDDERKEFWGNMPQVIEVKYQDALPSGSLRFPIFQRVRDDKDADGTV